MTVWYESLTGDIRALDRCSLALEKDRVTCLLGVNGAGKTTLMRTLSGVAPDFDAKVTAGSILFEGRHILGMKPGRIVSLGVAQAPQGRHIFHTMSVRDNLMLGAAGRTLGCVDRAGLEASMNRVFNVFPLLKERERQKSGTLSGGEQQMLSIGRALMTAPRLLLLDEPLMGLAPVVVEEILEVLPQLRQQGVTVLLAEQRAAEALPASDHACLLDLGFVVADGSPGDLLEDPRIRRLYLGD